MADKFAGRAGGSSKSSGPIVGSSEVTSSGNTNYENATVAERGLSVNVGGVGNTQDIKNYQAAHKYSDVDSSNEAMHHTLGLGPLQAIPASLLQNIAPIGELVDFVGGVNQIPPGFMLCDGRSLLKANYPQLFELIGYKYGGADANFNLPDSRRRGTIGANDDSEVGQNDGLAVGSRIHTTPEHTHDVTTPSHSHTVTTTGSLTVDGAHSHTASATTLSSGDHGHTTLNAGVHNHILDSPSATFNAASGGSGVAGQGHVHSVGDDLGHYHDVNSTGSHQHPISVSTYDSGAHQHVFTGSSSASSDSGASTSTSSSGGGTRVPFLVATKMIRYSWGFKETSY